MSSTGQKQTENSSLNDMLRQVGIDDVGAFVNQFRNKVNQENANQTHSNTASSAQQQPDLMSMGSSFLNQLGGGKKGQDSGSGDLISGAFNAYKMFSGGSSGQGQASSNTATGGGSAGGNPMDMINSAMKVYKMFSGGKDTTTATGGTNTNTNTGASGGGGNIFDTIGTAYGSAQQLQGFLKKLDRNGDGKVTIEDIELLLQGLGLGSVSGNVSKALFKAVDRNGNGELDLPDVMALAAIVNKLVGRFGAQGVNQQAQSSQ